MTSPQPEHFHKEDGKPCHHFVYHGLTCAEYEDLRARADGRCEICGVAESDTRRGFLVVDHFEAGRDSFIRGMICDACNSGVMSCLDGNKIWGSNRRWEQKAREYEANSWDKPSDRALRLLASRKEMVREPPRPPQKVSNYQRPAVIQVPRTTGMRAAARRLWRNLSSDQIERLIGYLREMQ